MHRVEATGAEVSIKEGRDLWWHELMAKAEPNCPAEPLDSETPLFILYTSGSTGKPKGIMHTTAGYILYAKKTMQCVFDIRDEDIYWCTADIGWVTGHSYVVYGPLAAGATVFLYEGAPELPRAATVRGKSSNVTGSHILHRADGHPSLHQVGRPACRAARPQQPPPAGLGGRGNQSRGVDVVPREDRRQPMPDRGHVVADGNRGDHDEPAARLYAVEAGVAAPSPCRESSPKSSMRTAVPSSRAAAVGWSSASHGRA